MNKIILQTVLLSSVFQLGCSNREVLLESGTYKADSSAGVLGLLSSVSSDVIEDFEMTIDVGALTATPFSNQSTAIALDLIEIGNRRVASWMSDTTHYGLQSNIRIFCRLYHWGSRLEWCTSVCFRLSE